MQSSEFSQGKTCFKNLQNPSCIDLFIISSPLRFQNRTAISIGLFDHHKQVATVIKEAFQKNLLKEIWEL